MPHPPLPGEQPPGEPAEELLAILAHELRQPLTALRGALLTLQHRTQALSDAQRRSCSGWPTGKASSCSGCSTNS
jgi:His Kinase A (phospho-acceptor) domain